MSPLDLFRKPPPFFLLLAVAAFLWFGEYVRRDLWDPDEARYAYVTQEMRTGAHWVVPFLNGMPYPDKPPLFFWLIHFSSLLFTGGAITSFSVRMPGFIGALLTLWASTRLIAHWRNSAAAWRTLGILFTTYLFWHEGGWGRLDSLLCGLTFMSIYCFTKSTGTNRRAAWELGAYLWAGLATFLKGPVGLLVPMLGFGLGSLAAGEKESLRRWHWLWGPAIAILFPLAWLLTAWLKGAPDGFFAAVFGAKSFGRVLADAGHARPFYYYLYHFPIGFLPWAFFLPAAAVALPDRALNRRLAAWLGGILLLFSCFVCKRNVYILSAYPVAAMWLGAAWPSLARAPLRWVQIAITLTLLTLGGLSIAAIAAAGLPLSFPTGWPFAAAGLIPAAGTIHLAWLAWNRKGLKTRWLCCCCTTLFLTQWVVGTWALPAQNAWKAPREAARLAAARLDPGEPVYLYQQQLALFPFYAGHLGREIRGPDNLAALLAAHSTAVVVMRENHWESLQTGYHVTATWQHAFRSGSKKQILLTGLQFPPAPNSD